MGAEQSHEPINDSVEPEKLKRRDLKSVAEYIKSGKCEKIMLMVGAGISTSAGIPDFRSPDTGLYANLARLNLPHPEAVFDISFFRRNPLPFYTLAHELYPGRFRPTVTHAFINLLHRRNLLLRCYTQNIDTLERIAGVPEELIIEAHGSFATQRCIDCKTPFPDEEMRQHVADKYIPFCKAPQCNGMVKPDIVFFGEALPQKFHESAIDDTMDADLGIVLGTSLTVAPFASLPQRLRRGNPRLLINKEQVGDLGTRSDDVLLLGDCDSGVRKLCKELGWEEELEAIWAETSALGLKDVIGRGEVETMKPSKETLNEEVERLTRDVEKSLNIAKDHKTWVEGQLAEEKKPRKPRNTPAVESDGDFIIGSSGARYTLRSSNTKETEADSGTAKSTKTRTSPRLAKKDILRPLADDNTAHQVDKKDNKTDAEDGQQTTLANILQPVINTMKHHQESNNTIAPQQQQPKIEEPTTVDKLTSNLESLTTTDTAAPRSHSLVSASYDSDDTEDQKNPATHESPQKKTSTIHSPQKL